MWTNIKTIFLSLTCVLFISLGALACETSADCGTGEYCKQGMGSSKNCSDCTSHANATFTGSGTGFGDDNCPWKCINGYKKNSGNTACEPCAANYFYHAATQKCIACPYGSISTGTANGNDCYWSSAPTLYYAGPSSQEADSTVALLPATNNKIYLSKQLHDQTAQSAQQQ